jgi:hypothetical protein
VVAIDVDESDGPASVRVGQIWGLDREKLERRDAAEIAVLESEMAGIAYTMADPEEVTLEPPSSS